ncbi:caspase family protein [Lentzea sp. NEAU-D13]|uniref:Caspase family protein n=1 Tax=Lentzea alba TaxID=2714351 RepID=A0A7C9S0T9_9PSEU|nr:caspase family protein [Lentzea alba]NGY65943.1 caspase family protein [Lentzea alba]
MKRALLVGVDHYDHHRNLSGCANDARAIEPLLAFNEDRSRNLRCHSLTETVTRSELRTELKDLLAAGADFALLYFAGHGAQETNDLALMTSDSTSDDLGVRFSEVLALIGNSDVKEVVVILDCCFSGTAGTVPGLSKDSAVVRSGVSILTASRGDQLSAEVDDRGVFSSYLEGALDGGAADVLGQVTVAGLYSYLWECFDDWGPRPTFKTNVDRLHAVRRCKPSIPVDTLRELTNWFPSADYEFPLDPTYEPDKEKTQLPPHPVNEAVFAKLQACRANKLVEPVAHEHMYFAAINRGSCRLTPLGKHYWSLAEQDLL